MTQLVCLFVLRFTQQVDLIRSCLTTVHHFQSDSGSLLSRCWHGCKPSGVSCWSTPRLFSLAKKDLVTRVTLINLRSLFRKCIYSDIGPTGDYNWVKSCDPVKITGPGLLPQNRTASLLVCPLFTYSSQKSEISGPINLQSLRNLSASFKRKEDIIIIRRSVLSFVLVVSAHSEEDRMQIQDQTRPLT